MFLLSFISLFVAQWQILSPNLECDRLIVAASVVMLSSHPLKWKLELHHKMLLVWLAWCAVCCWFSPYPGMAFYGFNPFRCEGLITWLLIACIAFSYRSRFESIGGLAFVCVIFCLAYAGSWAIARHYGHGETGFMKGLYLMSGLMLPPTAIASLTALTGAMVCVQSPFWCLLILPTMLAVKSRGAMVAIGACLVARKVLLGWRPRSWDDFYSLLSVLIVGGTAFILFISGFGSPHFGMGARSQWLFQGWALTHNLPVTGYGLDTLSNYLTPAIGLHGGFTEATIPDRCHNLMMDWIIQTGWVGYVLLCMTFGAAWGTVWKNPTKQNVACLLALVAWVVVGFVNPQGILSHAIALTCFCSIKKEKE